MKQIQISKHAGAAVDIRFNLIEKDRPEVDEENNCLIQVVSVGVNPSDALAAMGYFSHAVLPRIPGRDFAGVVVAGPPHLLGQSVWGSGGAAGIDFDGSLAEFITLPESALAIVPADLNLLAAGAQTLPYITAYASLVQRAVIQPGETVYVIGALGQVGQAAMSIARWQGCQPVALVYGADSVALAEQRGWAAYDTSEPGFIEKVLAKHGQADVILNSVGNIIWEACVTALAECGRIVNIGARPGAREVVVNLFELYRANQRILGVNTVSFSHAENAEILRAMQSGFESGDLESLAVDSNCIYGLEQAAQAFQQAYDNRSRSRVVIEVCSHDTIER